MIKSRDTTESVDKYLMFLHHSSANSEIMIQCLKSMTVRKASKFMFFKISSGFYLHQSGVRSQT